MMVTERDSNTTPGVTLEIDEALHLALKLHKGNCLPEAEHLYKLILKSAPENLNALHFLGLLCHQQNRHEEAVALIERIIVLSPDNADAHNNLGNVLEGLGRGAESEACYRKAISLNPGHGPAHNNLGVVLMALNRSVEAVEAYRSAAELAPNSAEFRYNMGNALRKSGDLDGAISAYREAVSLAPDYAVAWQGLARSYLLANRREEAADMFEKWLEKDPGNPVILFLKASFLEKDAPERAPNLYIEQVFDDLANSFDSHLIAHLEYRAPALLTEALAAAIPEPAATLDILDAGCGTGLCAPLLRPYARCLSGVDLSPGMLARARGRKIYDELILAELTDFLNQKSKAFDIIASADTLCYFGVLESVFKAAAGALKSDGILAFTLEDAGDDSEGFRLNSHGRYAHSRSYVKTALEAAGLGIHSISFAILRKENEEPVPGQIVVSRKRR
ncbi:MAG: tetratricopeptide repeat protein [Pseudomonadota bacterium]